MDSRAGWHRINTRILASLVDWNNELAWKLHDTNHSSHLTWMARKWVGRKVTHCAPSLHAPPSCHCFFAASTNSRCHSMQTTLRLDDNGMSKCEDVQKRVSVCEGSGAMSSACTYRGINLLYMMNTFFGCVAVSTLLSQPCTLLQLECCYNLQCGSSKNNDARKELARGHREGIH